MRRTVTSALVAVAAGMATLGLSFASFGGAAAAQANNQTLTVALISTGTSRIPAFTSTGEDVYINNLIYGSLLQFKPGTTTLEPSLATGYTATNGDRTWTFSLRHGVQWQGGYGLFTCNDVRFTWNFNRSPQSLWRSQASTATVACPNPYTAVFHLTASNSNFGLDVANIEPSTGYMMSAAAWKKLGAAGYDKTPIGTGPYELKSLDPNVSVSLVANPTYWGPKPGVGNILIKVITNNSTAALAVQSGSLDIAAIDPVTAAEFAHTSTAHILVKQAIFPDWLEINTKLAPFNNLKVREAMRYAINYQAIKTDVFRGDAGPVTQGVILPGQIGYNPKFDPPNVYNPGLARKLLKESGVKLPIKGFFTTYNDSQDVSVGQLIQEDLSQVGIDLVSRPLERGTLDTVRTLPTTPATILGATLTPDPSFLLGISLISSADPPAGLDTARYAGIDKLYQEQLNAPSLALRVRYLGQLEQRLTADVPAIVVDNQDLVWIVNNKVHNYYPTTVFSGDPLWLVKLSG